MASPAIKIYYIINGVAHLLVALAILIIVIVVGEVSCSEINPIDQKTPLWISMACFIIIAGFCFLISLCCADNSTTCIIGVNVCVLTLFYVVIVVFTAIAMFNNCQSFNKEFNLTLWNTNTASFSIAIILFVFSTIGWIIICCSPDSVQRL